MTISTAEKIETIFLSQTSGSFGTFTRAEDGTRIAVVDGKTYSANTDKNGWWVRAGDFIVHDTYLIDACMDAVAMR